MLRLAYENGKLLRMPIIRKLKEGGPRQGSFEKEQYMAVRRHLRPDLQLAIDIEYTYGWRNKSEALSLERRHIDLKEGTLRLEPGTTKDDDGRIVYLTTELKAQISAQLDRVRAVERKGTELCRTCSFTSMGRIGGSASETSARRGRLRARRRAMPGACGTTSAARPSAIW
jgi:integrase